MTVPVSSPSPISESWKNLIEFEFPLPHHLNVPKNTDSTTLGDDYLHMTAAFTLAYAIVTALSLVGNTLILIVLVRRKRMRRTVTNFFLANITLANLVYTVCAPLKFFSIADSDRRHYYGEQSSFTAALPPNFVCKVLPFVSTVAINVNTFSMVAASVERFATIVYPFVGKLGKRTCLLSLVAIWILACLVSAPWFVVVSTKFVISKSRSC